MSDERTWEHEAVGASVPPRVAAARRAALELAGDGGLAAPMRAVEALLASGVGPLEEAQQEALIGHMDEVLAAAAKQSEEVGQAVGQWFAAAITVAGRRADPLVPPIAMAFWWRGKETELPDSREVREVMTRFQARIPSGEPVSSRSQRPSAAWYGAVVAGAILVLGAALLVGWLVAGG